jgi:hypothetical protein
MEKSSSILDSLVFFWENEMQTFYYKPIPSFYVSKGNAEIDFFLKKGAF